MLVENLIVNRVILHEVHKRKDERMLPPTYGTDKETLDPKAMIHFGMRITDALSAQSRSIEMAIVKTEDTDVLGSVKRIAKAKDPGFVEDSKRIAFALADAQRTRGIPGGMVLVFDGTVGIESRPFVGVIKAELQTGFRRQKTAESVVTEFLDTIFLTPATRLYKLGIFISPDETPDDATRWSCHVFDSNISASRREDAAHYFYSGFLGCEFPESGRHETVHFFDYTKEFVRSAPVSTEERRDLGDALYSFIKVNQSPTFTTRDFAESFLPIELRDSYDAFMKGKKFPTDRAVVKDVSAMGSRLRRRKFRFGGDAEFSVSPEALSSGDVTIKKIPSEDAEVASTQSWTVITVKRPMMEL